MDPYNGEIIAMASIPDFNLNNYRKLPSDSSEYYYKNRVISSQYEPGSTFKIVCFSAAFDNNSNQNHKYFCENGNYIGRYQQPFTWVNASGSDEVLHRACDEKCYRSRCQPSETIRRYTDAFQNTWPSRVSYDNGKRAG